MILTFMSNILDGLGKLIMPPMERVGRVWIRFTKIL